MIVDLISDLLALVAWLGAIAAAGWLLDAIEWIREALQ